MRELVLGVKVGDCVEEGGEGGYLNVGEGPGMDLACRRVDEQFG